MSRNIWQELPYPTTSWSTHSPWRCHTIRLRCFSEEERISACGSESLTERKKEIHSTSPCRRPQWSQRRTSKPSQRSILKRRRSILKSPEQKGKEITLEKEKDACLVRSDSKLESFLHHCPCWRPTHHRSFKEKRKNEYNGERHDLYKYIVCKTHRHSLGREQASSWASSSSETASSSSSE